MREKEQHLSPEAWVLQRIPCFVDLVEEGYLVKWERLTWAQGFSVAPLCDKEEGMVVRVRDCTEKASIDTEVEGYGGLRMRRGIVKLSFDDVIHCNLLSLPPMPSSTLCGYDASAPHVWLLWYSLHWFHNTINPFFLDQFMWFIRIY